MNTYRAIQPDPPAALQACPEPVEWVGIRKAPGGDWLPVPLLATRLGWACVDDGQEPLWVMIDHLPGCLY